MRLYLDDDTASAVLVRLLRAAGHDVQIPADAALAGADDPVHLTYTIANDRVLVTRNYQDFGQLHNLILQAGGHLPGLLIIRRDANTVRAMSPHDIVRALRNLEAAGVAVADQYIILNAWQ
jgi:predicted nuclease of predicted toxin-antitoxin system